MDRLEELSKACRQEQERITAMRLFAWSSAPQERQLVPGVALVPLTFRRWLDLLIIESPILGEGIPERADYLRYIWHASAGYRPGDAAALQAFDQSRIHELDTDTIEAHIYEHVDENFFDAPRTGGTATSALPPVEGIVALVCEIARILHKFPAECMDMPLLQGFALIRSHCLATDEKYSAPIPPSLNHLELAATREVQAHLDEATAAWGD